MGLLLLLLLLVSKMLSCVRTDCVVLCVVLLEVHAELEMLMADGATSCGRGEREQGQVSRENVVAAGCG